MQCFETNAALRQQLLAWRRAGDRIAFVPTMGHLHAGHLALVDHARSLAERVVVSIYVNPLQFDNNADLKRYPQTLAEDRLGLEEVGVDVLYLPDAGQIYPYGIEASVQVCVPALSDVLEGASRPGHFKGVATVVAKLFNIVQPDLAIFGEKDWQQLLLIRRLVADLCMPLDIVAVATVREADGLAMSSRNSHLSAKERQQAGGLYQVLLTLREQWHQQRLVGSGEWRMLERSAMAALEKQGLRADYISIRRRDDLAEPPSGQPREDQRLIVLAAAWVGKTRLIDNLSL